MSKEAGRTCDVSIEVRDVLASDLSVSATSIILRSDLEPEGLVRVNAPASQVKSRLPFQCAAFSCFIVLDSYR